jgi:hypothetical protein
MTRALPVLFAALSFACSSDVVLEDPGAGGSGTTSGTVASGTTGATTTNASATATATTGATSASTGMTGLCSSHDQCAPGVCHFPTGVCVTACAANACDSCGPGAYCEPCAMGSSPGANDCVAACLPAAEGRCDDDDPCPPESACYFPGGVCMQPCNPNLPNGGCGDFEFCDFCATGSCCGCDDCTALCMGGE